MHKRVMGSLLLATLAGPCQACFLEFPGIQTEQIAPFGVLVWSPLTPTTSVQAWLRDAGFQSLAIQDISSEWDVFWVKGRCLAQVIGQGDGIHSWLVGSEHSDAWFNHLEAPDATRT